MHNSSAGSQTKTRLTEHHRDAILIEVAELGAALGSGDMELAEQIESDTVDLRTSASNTSAGQNVSECLRELLDGGALADENVQGYVDAFSLLCQNLGTTLAAEHTTAINESLFCDSPFDIPVDVNTSVIHLIEPSGAAELLGRDVDGQSIVVFTHRES